MPQLDPEFEIMKDAEEMIVKLCDMYPDKLGHIAPESILVAAVSNKPKPDSMAYDSSIVGIKPPVTLCTAKRYIVWFYKNIWDGYTKAQREIMMLSKLLRIDPDCEGKVLPEDLKDVKCLVKSFGVDYQNNANLPSLLEAKQTF